MLKQEAEYEDFNEERKIIEEKRLLKKFKREKLN